MVEQRPPKPKVVGSIPITDAFLLLYSYNIIDLIWFTLTIGLVSAIWVWLGCVGGNLEGQVVLIDLF